MGVLVYKSHYVRGGAKVKNYVTYIGTRPGVIKMLESKKDEPAIKKPEDLYQQLHQSLSEADEN